MKPVNANGESLPFADSISSKLNSDDEEEDNLTPFDYNYYTFMPASELNGKEDYS